MGATLPPPPSRAFLKPKQEISDGGMLGDHVSSSSPIFAAF